MPQRGTERFDAVDWNYWRATAAFCATARDGDVRETRRFLLADVGVPAGAFNLALVARPEADLETALDAATAFFGDKQHPFRVSFRAEHVPACEPLLKDRGFTRADDIPGMLLARPPVTLPEADGVRFRRVEDAATLADF